MAAAYDRLKALTHLKKTAMGKSAYLNQAYIGDVEVVWVSTKVRTSVASMRRLPTMSVTLHVRCVQKRGKMCPSRETARPCISTSGLTTLKFALLGHVLYQDVSVVKN